MKQIAGALLKAQSEMSNPVKGSNNPYFKSKYADLNAVREAVIPTLNSHGITVLQPIVSVDGKNYVKTVLLHESGEVIESFTEIVYSKQNDAQAQGSGITYARRYGLQSLVCIGADDDDGNGASNPTPDAKQTKTPAPKTAPKAAKETAAKAGKATSSKDLSDAIVKDLKQAKEAIQKCIDEPSLNEVMKTFKSLWSNDEFKSLVQKTRASFNGK